HGLLGPGDPAPDPGPVAEEALVPGQAVRALELGGLPDRDAVGRVPDRQPTDVADVLTDRQGAVDGVARGVPGPVLAELLDERIAPLLEGHPVGLGPPLPEVALPVEGRPGIIEAVPDLVTDDRTDPAVVVGVLALRVEEGRLEDRGRE